MLLEYLPDRLPRIDVRVLARQMDGDFQGILRNLSPEINIPAGQLRNTLESIEENARATLMEAVEAANAAIPKGEVAKLLLSFAFEGAWDLIRALWEYIKTRKVTVRLRAPTQIMGYETPDFIVDNFAKEFIIEAKVPVDQIKWHAW